VVSGLAGGLLVLGADLIGRNLFSTTEIPVGVITGVVAGPYLLWLLARANKIGRTG
jgi:iron complex transport system permease protein